MRSIFSRTTADAVDLLKRASPNAMVNLMWPVKHRAVLLRARIRMMEEGDRLKPSFLIIGAKKAGTTALFNYLIRHPEVASPLVKEIHYFDYNWVQPLAWYLAHFPRRGNVSPEMVTGEASPTYLPHPMLPSGLRLRYRT